MIKQSFSDTRMVSPQKAIVFCISTLYLFAIIIFIITPIQAVKWAGLPFPGFLVEQTLLVSAHNGRDWILRDQLRHQQLITEVNGQSVNNSSQYQKIIAESNDGDQFTFTIYDPVRSEARIFQDMLSSFPGESLWQLFWLPYFVGVVYLFLGFTVLRQRFNHYSGQAFAFFCVVASLSIILLFDLVSVQKWVTLWSTLVAFLGSATIGLALFFPERLPSIYKKRWLVILPVGISILLSVLSGNLNFNVDNRWGYIKVWEASYIYAVVGLMFFFGMLVYRTQSKPSQVVMQQLRITLWGSIFAFIPTSIWFISPLIGLNISWNPVLFLPTLLFFPIAIALAIVRYRLWDIEVIINRTLVYGVLTIFLVIIFILVVTVINLVLADLIQQLQFISASVSSILITLLFNPMRLRIQYFIDRRFFRQKYDIAQALTTFQNSVRDTIDLEILESNLMDVIDETMQPSSLALHICTIEESRNQNHRDFYIDQNDNLRKVMLTNNNGVDITRLNIESNALDVLRSSEVVLSIPLTSQNELIGILNLGKRKSDQLYSLDDRRLLMMLAAQVAPAIRVAQLVREFQVQVQRQERIEHELDLAHQVQMSVLPQRFPEITGFKFAARSVPARQVGGDFYDVINIDDEYFGFAIADVSDKGMPAALYMALSRSLMVAQAQGNHSPEQVLREVNSLIQDLSTAELFVTIFYGIVNKKTKIMTYTRAGHDWPILLRNNSCRELKGQGVPVGIFKDKDFQLQEMRTELQPGDKLILYTDGLMDINSPDGVVYGREKFLKLLSQNVNLESEELCQFVFDTLKVYCETADQFDDMTMLIVESL